MNWYYAEAGQQLGPVSDEQLQELIRAGRVTDETLVWREGLADWQPYASVRAAGVTPPGTPPPPVSNLPPATEPVKASGVCVECGRMFSLEEMIRHRDVYVCARCKPVFMRKLSEGVAIPSSMEYAGFWIRLGAKILDNIILMEVTVIPILILVFVAVIPAVRQRAGATGGEQILAAAGNNAELLVNFVGIFVQLIFLGLNCVYTIFFLGKYGATPGKMLCKLRVVSGDGQKVGYSKATGRYFAELLSGMICNIGYIIAAFDDQKRALHDHICNTRVVHHRD